MMATSCVDFLHLHPHFTLKVKKSQHDGAVVDVAAEAGAAARNRGTRSSPIQNGVYFLAHPLISGGWGGNLCTKHSSSCQDMADSVRGDSRGRAVRRGHQYGMGAAGGLPGVPHAPGVRHGGERVHP